MRRADRLFRITQALRSDRWVTARTLAQRLEVSERTIYRDIQDLSCSGIPIIAEAGMGYRLMAGFRLPPLMFTEDELEALLLGMRMVGVWSDPQLADAAERAVARIEAVLPERLTPELARNTIMVPPYGPEAGVGGQPQISLRVLRQIGDALRPAASGDDRGGNRILQRQGADSGIGEKRQPAATDDSGRQRHDHSGEACLLHEAEGGRG